MFFFAIPLIFSTLAKQLIQLGTHIYPVEVKAEENLQAKSLKTTLANNLDLQGLRFSMSDFREQDRLTNVPLYGIKAYLEALARNSIGSERYVL